MVFYWLIFSGISTNRKSDGAAHPIKMSSIARLTVQLVMQSAAKDPLSSLRCASITADNEFNTTPGEAT